MRVCLIHVFAIALSLWSCDGNDGRNGSAAASSRGRAASDFAGAPDVDCRTAAAHSSDIRIASAENESGVQLTVTGVVLDAVSREPLPGVKIYAYHTDASGLYSREGPTRPRLCGKLITDADGRYRITTIKPGAYPQGGNPSHIHFELSGDAIDLQHQELFFDGDRHLTDEFIRRELPGGVDRSDRSSMIRPTSADASGAELCERDFIVRTR